MDEKIESAVRKVRGAVVAFDLRECADYIESTREQWTVDSVIEMLRNRAELMEG